MIRNRQMSWVCGGAVLFMVLAALALLGSGGGFLQAAAATLPYTEKLFNTSRVHTVDIVAKETDWQEMLDNAVSEEYISCSVVIDGEAYQNVGIRPKGNSSLSQVASSGSDRYSFKLEFDHYDTNISYYGLDKLCLNNLIQDNTCLKDFLCYQMMAHIGADSPLCSYVWIMVNGKDWGLYLATEAIEEAFALRNYGTGYGKLYKPDSMDMGGGGRGAEARNTQKQEAFPQEGQSFLESQPFGEMDFGEMPQFGGFGKAGGMGGSSDVLLQYTGDDPESYPNLFENAVFPVTKADQTRLIASLKELGEGKVEASVNTEEVLRYFAVHNFVLNEDSYTGSIIHNYYLYEKEGLLSMIPWDYNLAFGGMGGGSAEALVNSPIDSPVSSGDLAERPMVAWIFQQEAYTQEYHDILKNWIAEFFDTGYFEELLSSTIALISPYIEQDPTAFCTYQEFLKGGETLKNFCLLRAESVKKQLAGAIPSTSEGQGENSSALLSAEGLEVASMGSNKGFGGMGMPGERPQGKDFPGAENSLPESPPDGETPDGTEPEAPDGAPSIRLEEDSGKAPQGPTEEPSSEEELAQEEDMPREGPWGRGAMLPEGMAPAQGDSGTETWLLLGGSALLLLLGLAFAKFYG